MKISDRKTFKQANQQEVSMNLPELIHRIATDRQFAARVQRSPEATLATCGACLQPDELSALRAVLSDQGLMDESIVELKPEPALGWIAPFSLEPRSA